MYASHRGHTETAKLLIEKGAEVNAVRKDGGTALKSASSKGYTEIVNLLKAKGAR
jgi:ankyrin repeat protein